MASVPETSPIFICFFPTHNASEKPRKNYKTLKHKIFGGDEMKSGYLNADMYYIHRHIWSEQTFVHPRTLVCFRSKSLNRPRYVHVPYSYFMSGVLTGLCLHMLIY